MIEGQGVAVLRYMQEKGKHLAMAFCINDYSTVFEESVCVDNRPQRLHYLYIAELLSEEILGFCT